MIPALPVLAAGVVGTCLGATVTALWFRGRPVVPMVEARAIEAAAKQVASVALDEIAHSHSRVTEARAAMMLCAQKLSEERAAHFATKQRAETAESHLSDLRAVAAAQEAADEPAPALPPGVYHFQAARAETPWVPNFGGGA